MSDITYLDHDPRGIHGPALADLERNDHVHIRTSDVCIKNVAKEPCRVDWRARALEAEAVVERAKGRRAAYAQVLDDAIDEQNREWLPAIIGTLDWILEGDL